MVVFGGSYGIGGDIAELARGFGATVHSFSRSTTNTHVDRRDDIAAAAADGAQGVRLDRLRRQHRRRAADRRPGRHDRGDDLRRDRDQLPRTDLHRAGVLPAPRAVVGLAAAVHVVVLHAGSQGYSLYSSAKAAVVNLTQALADEWAGEVRVNCINPERTGTPMRTKAFGEEPEGTLLSSMEVARQSLDVLLAQQTGHIIDIRREDGPAAIGGGRSCQDARRRLRAGERVSRWSARILTSGSSTHRRLAPASSPDVSRVTSRPASRRDRPPRRADDLRRRLPGDPGGPRGDQAARRRRAAR